MVDAGLDESAGVRMHRHMAQMQPLPRSITGNGVRATLAAVADRLPLTVHEVASGTEVFDWVVPQEWSLREAYIARDDGSRVVDAGKSALHLVSYSVPFEGELTFDALRPHLHTLPDKPSVVPYRTSYYSQTWGFCLSQTTLDSMEADAVYRVVVDTTLEPGSLTYGECVLPGDSDDEVLLSTHVCHPTMANDNLSGVALLAEMGALLANRPHRYTYRLLFVPGTIGSLTWLSRNADVLPRVQHGLVITGVGASGPLVYKRTRHGSRYIDQAASHVVTHRQGEVRNYSPWGYDERQYNSIGFDLPVGRLTRTPHGEFPEYHTSADNLDFVDADTMRDSLAAYFEILDVVESDAIYVNLSPHGEPQLGKRGLYPATGGRSASEQVVAMLWVLGYSDGRQSLLDIAERAGLAFALIRRAAEALEQAGLLAPGRK